ncbi:PDR/VanB family oxidoreductase [Actinokineospora spheciospongiae]|uniref:PDR/VanB family oxidoreductase n=1 Tax=Actinokineospora spheciospongiae TaxID=909613 RepID=UPI000A059B47|nr:PDR/VanB family oxidoreductase [Actinokineospora spheciospongiae]
MTPETRTPPPAVAPPDLYGRARPDRMYRLLRPVVAAHLWLSKRSVRRGRPVPVVDRDLPVVVSDRRVEADGVVSLTLTAPSGDPLPPWRPGCHLDVRLPSGLRRQYSLCGDPADRASYRIAVRLVGEGSGEVHSAVRVGTPLVVRGPRTAFPLVGPGPHLFIAGGIGITPILPMLRAATDWHLVYAGRSRATMPFLAELEPHGDRVTVLTGVPAAPELLTRARPGTAVYACGPPPMLDAIKAHWSGALHCERFSPPPVVDGEPFELQLGPGGPVVPVAADESALTALRRARPQTVYSCQQGFCGTCRLNLVSTTDSMLVCTDRRPGRVVLDVRDSRDS